MSTPPEFPEHEAPLGLPPDTDETTERYVGLYTRVIAFVLDAALINLVAIVVAVGASLILSLFHIPKELKTVLAAIAGAAYIVWSIGYFVAFWSSTGQTPGSRLMQIRVVTANGGPFRPRRAILRCIGLVLAALPLFAGYVLILFDGKRRGFQDRLAGTLVVEAPQLSIAGARQASRRAAYQGLQRRPPAVSP